MTTTNPSEREIKEAVRDRYASAARLVLEVKASQGSGCCGAGGETADAPVSCCEGESTGLQVSELYGASQYDAADRSAAPDAAALASLGCGNPVAIAELHEGETVLDLGSGGGLDVLLSARRVGPTGFVYGLDMTDEMLELARRNQAEAGAENVEFLKGEIEAVPLPDHSVDVIISNCVINLSGDKPKVFREAHRVLRAGGRFAVSDIVTLREFTPQERADLAAWGGCIAGALTEEQYREGLEAAGFSEVEVQPTHEVGTDVVSAVIRARA